MNKNFRIISGKNFADLIKDYLDEDTLASLANNIRVGFPNTTKRQYATDPINITELKNVPYAHALLTDATAQHGQKVYSPKILFQNVEFSSGDSPGSVAFLGSDNQTHHVQPISATKNDVKVHCNCLDFYWRFAVWNDNKDSLLGNPPPPYHKKTDRPPVNPDQVSGMCKHIIKTAQELRRAGLLVD